MSNKEIIWNLVNSFLAGALVMLGSLSNGHPSWTGFYYAFIAALVVAVVQFKDFWVKEENEYSCKTPLFNFAKI